MSQKKLGNRNAFAFDDRVNLYSVVDILGQQQEIQDVIEVEDPNFVKKMQFEVTIRNKSHVAFDLQALSIVLTQFCRRPVG